MMRISILIPTLNEETCLRRTLAAVKALNPFEVIVADGGSTDRTAEIASEFATVIHSETGRGAQQLAAAALAGGDILWFLHADSLPSPGSLDAIRASLIDLTVAGGSFTLQFDGNTPAARHLTRIYPWLRMLGLVYGDAGIFVRASAYRAIGGLRPLPLFEDVDLVRRLRRHARFITLEEPLTTSSRRFEHRNFAAMFTQWMALQLLFWAGVSPHRLASYYRPVRKRGHIS